ncbi:MAG: hypothetical protein A3J74_10215 [Elusimicrobia bacterium RIFCSPHIGHO2_02_FULL_57_9]|nr:MAG: hypothetical protein A3J74_10215 [Elusimicrobia bacterium RIFCSPHIGHO2_02_FULL_57_9]
METKQPLILIIDDDPGLQMLLECFVKEMGLRSEVARNGTEAIDKIPFLKPDLIVLDLMLPGMSGLKILEMLQTGEALKIPVVVLTGSYIQNLKEKITACPNVVELLQKPIKLETFREVVARGLNRSKAA